MGREPTTNLVVETAAAAELAPRHAAGYLDGPVVRFHLRPFLAALQALSFNISIFTLSPHATQQHTGAGSESAAEDEEGAGSVTYDGISTYKRSTCGTTSRDLNPCSTQNGKCRHSETRAAARGEGGEADNHVPAADTKDSEYRTATYDSTLRFLVDSTRLDSPVSIIAQPQGETLTHPRRRREACFSFSSPMIHATKLSKKNQKRRVPTWAFRD